MNKKQLKHLKSLAHHLDPVVRLGQNGLTEAVRREFDIALAHHELIKIKLAGDRDEREAQLDALCRDSGAEVVQKIGHTATVFRRNPERPVIQFDALDD